MRKLIASTATLILLVTACDQATTTTTEPLEVFAAGLQTVEDCDELLDYYITHGVSIVGPYGLGGHFWPAPFETAVAEDAAAAGDGQRSFTGTNVQVSGVDEADIMKTDGNRIFSIVDGSLRIAIVDDDGVEMAGSLNLDWWPQGMLLAGDTILLVGGSWGAPVPAAVEEDSRIAPSYQSPTVRIVEVDVSDPNSPNVRRTLDLDGSYVDSRVVDDVARIAINSDPVGFEWAYPEGSGIRSEREAITKNREIIRNSTIDNWLPYFVLTESTGAEREGRLLDCTNVMTPDEFSGLSTLSILTFDLSDGIGSWQDAGVVASGTTMYATADHTYLATQIWRDWSVMSESEASDAAETHKTRIHLFDTATSSRPRYVGSGEVSGFLLNQFSMDEHLGYLRVATTTDAAGWGWSSDSESRVTILSLEAGLKEVGTVDGLGKTERIFAVRFMGDTGYVVTFRQTDPLYVVDLSDPTAPNVTGELKIPGYSAYLHPVGEDLLLGIGQDADESGRVKGTQISLFDVSDPSSPSRVDQLTREGAWSQVEGTHHAFTFWNGLALIPFERWEWVETGEGSETFDTGVVAVRIEEGGLSLVDVFRPLVDEPLTEKDVWRSDPYRMVPLRTTVIDGRLHTITNGGIAVHDLESNERIEFEEF